MRSCDSFLLLRRFISYPRLSLLAFLLILLGSQPLRGRPPQVLATAGPRIWLRDAEPIAVSHVGSTKAMQTLSSAEPLALAKADFDADGVDDLVVGYASANGGILAFHRGNLDAFAPQSEESFQAIGRGEFPSPFLPTATLVEVPVRPDFVQVGSFNGEGYPDVIVAQRNDSSVYLLGNNGKGVFAAPQRIDVGGPITTTASGDLGPHGIYSKLLVGISDHSGSHLMVFTGTLNGLGGVKVLSLPGRASDINFGHLGDNGQDAIFVAGGQVMILHSSSMRLETLSLPVTAQSIALGSFIWDRNPQLQIAVMDSNGTVHIAAHSEFDARSYTAGELGSIARSGHARLRNSLVHPLTVPMKGWQIIETLSGIAPSSGPRPIFLRTRISDHGADDLIVLNALTSQMTLIAHPDSPPGTTTFAAAEISYRPYFGSPSAAIAMRTNIDGRAGIVADHQGQVAPSVMMPLPDPTFNVNTTSDGVFAGACAAATPGQCTLREAILEANAASGTDTIVVPAGTYSLTIGRPSTPDYTGHAGALYVNDSVNIMGAGQNSTIIQWGTPSSGVVDMVMAVNEDINPITNATASISNLTIQNGVNHGAQGVDGDGGCMEFDTGSSGTATLTLTNVTLQNCSTLQGGGGGLVIFNFLASSTHGTAGATISNSIFQGNSVVAVGQAGNGGGIAIAQDGHMMMTASQVKNNNATQHNASGIGSGGGIVAFTPQNISATAAETFIHSSTISGNKAASFGGGINTNASISIDQGTVISGNAAGTDGTSAIANQEGGGLYLNPAASCPSSSTCTATLSKVTITGNTATGNGGGISYGNGSAGTVGSLSMSFCRLAAKATSGGSGSNLSNNHGAGTVTDDWWGTNSPAGTINSISATTTFDPFIVLTHTANPAKIRINQSTTLTGDMSKDNHGNGTPMSGNLDEIVGLPITFDSPVLGTIPQAQPETLGNPVPTATATFNAGGVGGLGSAHATVDQAVVPVDSNLIASATEAGTTATITTVGAHNFIAGNQVTITGVGVSGYNGTFIIGSVINTACSPGPTCPTQFTYTAPSGLASSSGGTANIGLVVLQPPSITKTFSPKQIQTTAGSGIKTSTITFAITNGNVVAIDASFTDNLPTNVGTVPGSLVVASTPNVVNPCGGTVTATAGSGTISYSNTNFPVGTCSITVDVQSAVDNIYSNSVTIDSTDAGNGNTASDTLNVINPPTIAKAFGAATIPLNGTTSLTFTVSSTNQNQTLSGISFTDTLPNAAPGTLVVATPNGLIHTCSTTPTAAAGSGTISLSGASLAPGASCTITVNVQGTVAGSANNSVTVSDTTAGTGNTGTANLTVAAPPTLSKAFNPTSIPLNGTSTLTFTISNPNTTAAADLTGVAFSDTLPLSSGSGSATLVVSSTPNVSNTCGGTVTATAGTGVISLSGASVAHSASCTLSVDIKGAVEGDGNNTTGAITSTQGGTGTTSNTALLKVVAPPTVSKAFGAASIPLNGTTTVTFIIANPGSNTTAESGIAFSDTLTNGLQVASTPGVSNTCGGTVTAAANSTSISLSGGSIATPGTSCTIVVNVTGTQSGTVSNTTGAVSSTNGGTGATSNTATLTVASPPTISKAFNPTSIVLNANSTLSFTIQNPNTNVALNGVAFTDNLPAGVVVAATPNVNGSCGSGTITAIAGSGSISLSGGTLATSGSCTFSVDVTGTTAGVKLNTTGAISSTEGGTGTTSNTASLTVTPATTSTTVTSSSNPLVFGQSVTFTATVTDTSAGSTAQPTGSVQFVVDGVNFGAPVALAGASSTSSTATSGATATLSVAGSPHSVTANYVNADGNFINSNGAVAGGQTINLAITNTAVLSSSNPSVFGESVTFTATVVDVSAGSTAQPTGAVQFVVDGVNFGSPVTLTGASSNSSTATSGATATLSIGGSPHTVTANYVNADGNFSNSSNSLSGGQVVNQANTTTTVGSSQGTITLGDTVTFTATVTANAPGSGTPTGLVTFYDGSTPIASGLLSGGQATFSTAVLAVGTHSITAIYQGDADFTTSPLSSPTTETVNLRGSSSGVVLNPTTVSAGQASTTTITVTDGGASTPPGTPDVFAATGAPATGRTGFTATLIADGAVVITGGTDANQNVLQTAEVYSGGSFTPTPGNLNTARTGAVAVLLPNAKVLIVGGSSNGSASGALNSAELLDLKTGTFAPTGQNMTAARFGMTAILLNNGKVLITGGQNSGGVVK